MNILGYFQKLGKALMLPIAVLPVAGILMRFGQPDLLDIAFIGKGGESIFNNLPLLFAMGVAAGLSKDNSAAAAISAAVGFFIMNSAMATLNPVVAPIGLVLGGVYFTLFVAAIRVFKLKTPGREDNAETAESAVEATGRSGSNRDESDVINANNHLVICCLYCYCGK